MLQRLAKKVERLFPKTIVRVSNARSPVELPHFENSRKSKIAVCVLVARRAKALTPWNQGRVFSINIRRRTDRQDLAEREGFEPPLPFRADLISSQAPSTGLGHLSAFRKFGNG